MASRTPTPDSTGPRDRLPNLFEVLSRRTTAPVDLFSFYIYMRDVQRSVDYLDFWYAEYVRHARMHWRGSWAGKSHKLTIRKQTGSMSPNTCPFADTMFANYAALS